MCRMIAKIGDYPINEMIESIMPRQKTSILITNLTRAAAGHGYMIVDGALHG